MRPFIPRKTDKFIPRKTDEFIPKKTGLDQEETKKTVKKTIKQQNVKISGATEAAGADLDMSKFKNKKKHENKTTDQKILDLKQELKALKLQNAREINERRVKMDERIVKSLQKEVDDCRKMMLVRKELEEQEEQEQEEQEQEEQEQEEQEQEEEEQEEQEQEQEEEEQEEEE